MDGFCGTGQPNDLLSLKYPNLIHETFAAATLLDCELAFFSNRCGGKKDGITNASTKQRRPASPTHPASYGIPSINSSHTVKRREY